MYKNAKTVGKEQHTYTGTNNTCAKSQTGFIFAPCKSALAHCLRLIQKYRLYKKQLLRRKKVT